VAKERNLPADNLRNTIADGRIFPAKSAGAQVVDGLGELEDAFAKAKQLVRRRGDGGEIWAPFSLSRSFALSERRRFGRLA